MPRAHSPSLRKAPQKRLIPLYIASLLLIFHSGVTLFINSSYLEQFIPSAGVGTIYTVGAALTVLVFLFISRVLHKVGNYHLTVALLIANLFAVIGMAFAESLASAIPLFVIHLIAVPLVFFNIDVFMEEQTDDEESSTGSKRGLLLALSSVISATTPLLSTSLVDYFNNDFTYAYLLSAVIVVIIISVMIFFFSNFSDPDYNEIDLFEAIDTFWQKPSIRNVFLSNFTLQLFFVSMVIYVPIYLTQNIGLSWTQLGIVIFFAHTAYIILEYPVGILADKYIGEKEMMSFGFFILALSTASIAFVNTASVVVWSIIMFITRAGASLIEVTTESYFFKQTKSNDAQVISFFRLTRPLSYVVGALFGSFILLNTQFNLLFIVFAFLMIPAMFFAMQIKDSR